MSKKKSLGHNPLSYSMLGKSNFDFIRSTDPNKDENGKSGSTKTKKRVVSYYLEDEMINLVKRAAAENNTSCSALVGEILKHSINNDSESEQQAN